MPRQQRGIALLTIMLILSLMLVIATEITDAFRSMYNQSRNRTGGDQAYWFTLSAEQLAVMGLEATFKHKPKTINLDQPWATSGQTFNVDGGSIGGQLVDAQACFNINSLAKATASQQANTQSPPQKIFIALLRHLGVPNHESEQIALATRNWLSNKEHYDGANDAYYSTLPLPYVSGKTLMRDVSEWRQVAGVSAAIAKRVIPFLCALPSESLVINVNTIAENQPELLAALYLEQLPMDQAESVLSERPKEGWDSIADFTSQPTLASLASTETIKHLTVTSKYFEVKADAQADGRFSQLRSLLLITPANKVVVVRRKLGGAF